MKKSAGFTLLEVMVVIVILGLLASFVVPNLMGNQEEAARQKVVVDIQQLENALDMYRLRNSFYPTSEQGLQALVTAATSQPVPRSFPADGFIRRLPKDPWGQDYILVSPGQMGKIDVFSTGPDRLAGTDDDIGNWNLDGTNSGNN
ncbi:type II secretion system major pseudopilin GspG [Alishewanella sp. d11]|uniref:type II secretion system major pseudopilin GspG n=1 Tax=Alishewanella sp. d11 TaxID=3414030 RepID=UPI003BF7F252